MSYDERIPSSDSVNSGKKLDCTTDPSARRVGNQDRKLTCDQVAWMLQAFDRYLPDYDEPGVSKKREMMKHALLYEVMDVARLSFEDKSAWSNAIPPAVRHFDAEEDEYKDTVETRKVHPNDEPNRII